MAGFWENFGKELGGLTKKLQDNKILQATIKGLSNPSELFNEGLKPLVDTFTLFANKDEVLKELSEFREIKCEGRTEKEIAFDLVESTRTVEKLGKKANSDFINQLEIELNEINFEPAHHPDVNWNAECLKMAELGQYYYDHQN